MLIELAIWTLVFLLIVVVACSIAALRDRQQIEISLREIIDAQNELLDAQRARLERLTGKEKD